MNISLLFEILQNCFYKRKSKILLEQFVTPQVQKAHTLQKLNKFKILKQK